MNITILGGTGYAGSAIVAEAASRGHNITAWSRTAPTNPIEGVTYKQGDTTDAAIVHEAITDSDVIIGALSPRGALTGRVEEVYAELAKEAQENGVRLGIIGGAGSLKVSEDGPTLVDAGFIPDEIKPEVLAMAAVLADLKASDENLDWFYFSPAGNFGAHAPGERTGSFRLGDDVLIVDNDGNSNLSAPDLGVVILDEIENPTHRRARFTAAY